jgi:hypothetical protein
VTALRTSGEPCQAGVFLVPSRSVPGDTYGLTLRGDGTIVCPCPSFHHRQRCRHADAVALAVEIEQQQAAQLTREAAAARIEEIAQEFAR